MSDLVERLREAAKMTKEKILIDVALIEAADEIERLRVDVEFWRAEARRVLVGRDA